MLPVKLGRFHSASGSLTPLGVVCVQLKINETELIVNFFIMENMNAKYFIIGNN